MALITIRDDGTWDYGTPGEADHFLGDHDSCLVVLQTDYQALVEATREFVHAQAVLTGDPVRAKRAGDRLVELGVIEESEAR